ncbi:MAG: ParB/RepB/Spo0J family partition protein [Candidatus Omnitrophica bacterium]|nr:ParB/RepB/Spo0J family partition protein [Candidatus Omnitrophota bacterium]
MEKRLGKGLDALISEDASKPKQKVEKLKLSEIVPNPFQPRKRFGQKKMEELTSSIQEKGLIQPILVRPSGSGYEIIAGERRFRAAQELGEQEIPAIIRNDIDDASSLEISLIENIQREELNPVEEAQAYQELIDKFEHTLEKVGQMMGKDKTTISNSIRLLGLSPEIKGYLEQGRLSTGHAKVLLSVVSEKIRSKLAKNIIRKGMSVREAEQLARRIGQTPARSKQPVDPEKASIEEKLQHKLGTKVRIHQGKKRGRIEIQYFSNEDLERLLNIMLS